MKKILLPLLAVLASLTGCHKDKNSNPVSATGVKIEIIKGNNQTDTLGNYLRDSIVVKVTRNGSVLKSGTIRFQTTGCDNNFFTDVFTINAGLARYQWQLNGTVGKQSLRIIFIDSLQAKGDSIEAIATGNMPTHGWYHSSCTPNRNNSSVSSLVKLSSGRLLASFYNRDYPYYSDDNAITWHPLKGFPISDDPHLIIDRLIVTPADEVLAATQDNGFYFSEDGGQTWEARNSGLTNKRNYIDMGYTRSGKLLYTTLFGGVYLSTDKGASWKSVMTGLPSSTMFYYPSEHPSGDLYIIDNVGTLYKSVNDGLQWSRVPLTFTSDVMSLFIDNNGQFIIGAGNYVTELYQSANGLTWSKVYSAQGLNSAYPELQNISKQDNGLYYFHIVGHGLISTADFKAFTKISPAYTLRSPLYTITKSGVLVIGSQFNGMNYFLP